MSPRLRWTFLGLLCAIFAILDLLVATVIEMRGDEFAAFILGTVFAQILSLAVWSALGSVSVFARMASGLVLAGLVSLCIFASDPESEEALVIAAAMFVQWFTIQVPLLVIRLRFGWHLAWSDARTRSSNLNETQFGIAQLLIWTALVAGALGVGRLLLPDETLRDIRQPGEAISIFGLLTVFNSLLAWPIVWAAFVRQRMVAWLVLAGIGGVGICFAETAAFKAALGNVDEEVFWFINGAQFAAGAGTLLLLRLCGLRLSDQRAEG